MAFVNIGGDAADTSYRYKMPRLVTKVEGRGNGIKTVIVNMVDIAKALNTDPAYPTKFFGIELGAQSKFNPSTERAIVNGCHDQPDVAKMLDKFIAQFILCPTCNLPEIKMKVKKSSVKIDCAACGHNGKLQTQHRLLTYILKGGADDGKGKKKKKKDKDGKDGKKKKKKKKGDDEEEEEGEKKEEGEQSLEAAAEAAAKRQNEKKSKKSKKDKEEEGEVEWHTDTSKDAQKARKQEEFDEMQTNEHISEVEKIISESGDGSNSATTVLKIFLASGDRSPSEVKAELRRLQLARGLDEPQKMKVLLEAIINLDDPTKVPGEYTKSAPMLKYFTSDRASAMVLLNCLEEQVGVTNPQLLSRTPLLLQALYESDVLEEDVLLSWYDAPPESSWLVNKDVAVAVRGKALPLINWLREADEESDDEE